jgi:shikimate dehydrogenase
MKHFTLGVGMGLGIGIAVGLFIGRCRRDKRPLLNKDTQVCISLARRPSNIGTRFHNYLYEELGLDFLYKAFTTVDIAAAIGGMKALGFRGCSVSMPFKEDVIALVDEMDATASAIQSVNTIVNTDGRLKAFNTDYGAVAELITRHRLNCEASVAIRGSGGMAKAVGAAFRDAGFTSGMLIARNASTGHALANELGYTWRADVHRDATGRVEEITADILVNVTPIGMRGGSDEDQLAFPDLAIGRAKTVFDVVAFPAETPLIRRARHLDKQVITGAEVIALQAAKQFELYTGVRPTIEQVVRASAYSRA